MKEADIRNRDTFNEYIRLSELDAETYFADRSKYFSIDCPACGSQGKPYLEKNSFKYQTCPTCDSFYVSPRPPIEQFEAYYVDSPSTKYWVEYFFKPMIDARRVKMFQPRAKFLADRLDNDGLTIGDVGAGFGLFLSELKKIRPNNSLVAIEPSVDMSKLCREEGLEVIPSLLEEITDKVEFFDVLTAFELFEHLNDPRDFVQKIHGLLKPGGTFLFTTLNGLGFDIQMLQEKSKSISPPHHLNFFNPNSVKVLLKNCGFDHVEVETPGILDWDIVEGMHKNEEVDLGPFWEKLSKSGSVEAKQDLQQWISRNGYSSHMRVIAKKEVK